MVAFAWLLFSGRLQSEVSLLGSFITDEGRITGQSPPRDPHYHSNFNYFIYSRCASVALLSVRGTGENGWELGSEFLQPHIYLTPNFFGHLRDLRVTIASIGG